MKRLKNYFFGVAYKHFIKKICFLFDAELIHNIFIRIGNLLGSSFIGKGLTRFMFNYTDKVLEQEIFGLNFKNPVGLAAGFDKNAEMVSIMEDVGFGFVEVGSITAKKCDGNSGKRLERKISEKSIWVNVGLRNKGAEFIKKNIFRGKIPLGISVAKTNCKETANQKKGIDDYYKSFEILKDKGDFFVINISCPNAYGGQPFHDAKSYEALMKKISLLKIKKPIFVKISPDLDKKKIDSIIRLSRKYNIKGFVISNLTKKGIKDSGGFSGKLVEKKSNDVLSYVYKKAGKEFVLIGVGGIFSAEDAYKKIKLGAHLVELVSGMIYEGPQLIGEINKGIAEKLKAEGYKNIAEARGKIIKNIF